MKRIILSGFTLASLLTTPNAFAQLQTRAQELVRHNGDDSLAANNGRSITAISGYGSASYQWNSNGKKGIANLDRVVLFVGHQFNDRFAVFTETELENAVVAGDKPEGEISIEQAFVRYTINTDQYLVAGLFVPRIGILNENHLPVNFNGVERPLVETYIIPCTWRELGIGWFGSFKHLELSAGLVNGLNNQGFEHGTGIREGRAEGALATTNNIALTLSAAYNIHHLRFQVSGYAGGTTTLSPRGSDSLQLNGGAFGTPVFLGEADVQYQHKAWSGKALASIISFPDAAAVNTAFGLNTASRMTGAYAELGYDLLYQRASKKKKESQLILFARYEFLDMNAEVPAPPKAIYDGTLKQTHFVAGLNFMPIYGLTFKADIRLEHTGAQNPDLVINPAPNALSYQQSNTLINLGLGYSF